MANPIFACRIPNEDLEAFREICNRYNLDPGDAVKRFMSDAIAHGRLPDEILNPASDTISLHDRVERLESRIEALEAGKKHHPPISA